MNGKMNRICKLQWVPQGSQPTIPASLAPSRSRARTRRIPMAPLPIPPRHGTLRHRFLEAHRAAPAFKSPPFPTLLTNLSLGSSSSVLFGEVATIIFDLFSVAPNSPGSPMQVGPTDYVPLTMNFNSGGGNNSSHDSPRSSTTHSPPDSPRRADGSFAMVGLPKAHLGHSPSATSSFTRGLLILFFRVSSQLLMAT